MGDLVGAKAELERALADTEEALGVEHPELAVVRSNLAVVLQGLGDLKGAHTQLMLALEEGEATLPDDHQGLWIRHRKLVSVLQGLRELAAAEKHAEKALELSKGAVGPDNVRVAGDLVSLAAVQASLGKKTASLEGYRKGLEIVTDELGADHLEVATYSAMLGRAEQGAGHLPAARENLQRTLEIYNQVNGADHPTTSVARVELAGLLLALGEETARAYAALGCDDEATRLRGELQATHATLLERELEVDDFSALLVLAEAARVGQPSIAHRALATAEALLARDTEAATTSARRRLGVTWYRLGREDWKRDERETATQAFELSVAALDGQPHYQGAVLHDLGDVRQLEKKAGEALDFYKRAAECKREAIRMGAAPNDLAITLLALGRALEGQGEHEAALDALRERLEILTKLTRRDPRGEGVTLHEIGDLLRARGETHEVADTYRRAAELQRQAGGAGSARNLVITLLELGRALLAEKDYEGALAAHQERLGLLTAASKGDPQAEGVALHDIGNVQRAQGKFEDAADSYRQATERKREAGDAGTPRDLGVTLLELGRALLETDDKEGALAAHQERYEILTAASEREPQAEGVALHDIGNVLYAQGKLQEAADSYRQAAERKREAGDRWDPRDRAITLLSLGRTLEVLKVYDAAFEAYDERLQILTALPEPDPKAEGVTLRDIGDVRHAQGRLREAVEFYRRAAERKREAGEAVAPRDLADTLLALGQLRDRPQHRLEPGGRGSRRGDRAARRDGRSRARRLRPDSCRRVRACRGHAGIGSGPPGEGRRAARGR